MINFAKHEITYLITSVNSWETLFFMGLKKSLDRIEYLDYLIRRKCTGTPKELSKKLGVSERWLYEILNELKKDLNFPIKYSRKRRSYVYTSKGGLVIKFMSKEEQKI